MLTYSSPSEKFPKLKCKEWARKQFCACACVCPPLCPRRSEIKTSFLPRKTRYFGFTSSAQKLSEKPTYICMMTHLQGCVTVGYHLPSQGLENYFSPRSYHQSFFFFLTWLRNQLTKGEISQLSTSAFEGHKIGRRDQQTVYPLGGTASHPGILFSPANLHCPGTTLILPSD